jgi:hypothetical protein
MAGVSDELPHPLLGSARRGLGVGPGAERGLNLSQHHVQRSAEPADLGPGIPVGDAAGQVPGRDGSRRLLDVRERAQAGADHGHPDDCDPGQQDHADYEVNERQPADRAVDAGDIDADDQSAVDLRPRGTAS